MGWRGMSGVHDETAWVSAIELSDVRPRKDLTYPTMAERHPAEAASDTFVARGDIVIDRKECLCR
jgi:hypothetical protein